MKGHTALRRWLGRATVAALVWTLVGASALVGESVPKRIVAVGDVHGAAGAFRALMREVGLVDENDDWVGGDTVLVQVGDLLDRGDSAVAVARWLRRLQEQAPRSGGRVHVLLGNHEALNLLGDYDYVTPQILAPLVDERSEARRQKVCRREIRIRKELARARGEDVPSTNLARNRCLADHPLGLVEYVELLEPDQELGAWFRSLPTVLVLGETLFVHGGIGPVFEEWGVEDINVRVRREIEVLDAARDWLRETGRASRTVRLQAAVEEARWFVEQQELGRARAPEPVQALAAFGEWLLVRADGPLWFRGWSMPEDSEAEDPRGLTEILASHRVRRMVIGHTPQKNGEIVPRFGNRVLSIDTGMLTAVYRGAPAALEIRGDRVEAVYLGRRELLDAGAEAVEP